MYFGLTDASARCLCHGVMWAVLTLMGDTIGKKIFQSSIHSLSGLKCQPWSWSWARLTTMWAEQGIRRWICNNSHSLGRHWSDFYREPFCITSSFIVNTANLISNQLPFYDASNAPWRDHQRQIFFFRSCFDSIENVCVLYFRPSRVQFTA